MLTGPEPSARTVSEIMPGVSRAASTLRVSTGGAVAVEVVERPREEEHGKDAGEHQDGQRQPKERVSSSCRDGAAHLALTVSTTSKWLIQPSSANSDWWAWNM